MEGYNDFINNILETRGRFNCDGYCERHHIQPKCLNGSNDENNLIDLYAREHFEAHRLLALENPDNNKLVAAWWMMSHSNGNDNQKWYELTSEEYEEARIAFVNSVSGENHPMFGKHLSVETKRKISEAHKGQRHSEEARRKMSEAHKGENNHNYGKPMSNEQKRKLSELFKGTMCGIDNPFYGRCHSEEAKHIMSEIAKERLQNPKNHPNYGKHLSDETRRKISESCRGSKGPQARKVDQYDLNGNFIRTWDYIKQAASELNISVSSISECCSEKYKRKTAGGFKWFYSDRSTQAEDVSSITRQNYYKEECSYG